MDRCLCITLVDETNQAFSSSRLNDGRPRVHAVVAHQLGRVQPGPELLSKWPDSKFVEVNGVAVSEIERPAISRICKLYLASFRCVRVTKLAQEDTYVETFKTGGNGRATLNLLLYSGLGIF